MTKRPEGPRRARRAALAGALAFAGVALAQDLPEDARQDWYRVELLVFLREDRQSLGAERWNPLPKLAYPDDARFLIDPDLADRRLEESAAYASTIDGLGVQHLLLPEAFSPLDTTVRPDSLIGEPYVAPLDPALEGEPGGALAGGDDGLAEQAARSGAGPADSATPDAQDEPDEEAPLIALAAPYQLLADNALEFRAAARSLRRRGHRVAFHKAWWVHLPPDQTVPALFLDRGADADDTTWPDLQGSVRIDRSRYLHIDIDLWLNTLAAYLPEGWQIDSPPLPPASVDGRTMTGAERNPWAPEPALPLTWPGPDRTPAADPEIAAPPWNAATGTLPGSDTVVTGDDSAMNGETLAEDEEGELTPPYPWRHAIVHRQSRRMRSGEVHYLDHPVIGVVVKLLPADKGLMPISSEEDIAFRERHGLPIVYVEPDDEDSARTGG